MLSTNEVNYYDFGDFRLDVARERLLKDGMPLTLTHKAFSTLLILVRNAGRVVEKEDLISELWADSFVEESNLSQYVYVLRKILGNDPNGNPYIETVTKRGFRFTAEVAEIPADFHVSNDVLSSEIISDNTFRTEVERDETGPGHTSFPPDVAGDLKPGPIDSAPEHSRNKNSPPPPPPPHAPKVSPDNNRLWLMSVALAFLTLGLISAAAYVYNESPTADLSENEVADAGGGIKAIAVLPFKQIGEENSRDKLGLGMADSIITHLSRIKLVPVRPTSSIFQFADKLNVDSMEVGRKLKVDAVLEGTILRENERVRVSVKLINIKNGEVFWAENYNENFTNIIALQDSISNTVAKSLSQNLFSPLPTAGAAVDIVHSTSNPEAYQAYLLGVYFWNIRTREGLEKAAGHFQRAIELDPGYARAYAMLADSYNMLGYYGHANLQEMLKKSRPAAEKALSLDETISEAHLAMSFIEMKEQKNPANSRRELERAIALNPYSSTARVRYGWFVLASGNINETVNQMRLAQEYDPLSPTSNNALCDVLMLQHNFEEAVKYCQKAVDISPQQSLHRIRLSEALFFGGKHQEAISKLQALVDSLSGEEKNQALGLLSYFYAKANHRAEAEKIVAGLKKKVAADPLLYEYLIPVTYALGHDEESLAHFKKARQVRFSDNLFRSRFALLWEEIRADGRFTL